MQLSVHLLQRPDQSSLDQLRASLEPNVQLTTGEPDASADYQILVAGRPLRDHIADKPSLQALVIPWSGVPAETRQLMLEFLHVAVHNLHYNAGPVAELAMALLLSATKFIVPIDRALRGNDWSPRYSPDRSVLLEGRTAVVLGYGAIGQRVARMCRGLGMEVVGIRRSAVGPEQNGADEVYSIGDLEAVLPRADALVTCLPHTPETDGLLGKDELALLPRDAVLVNVGRGGIVDEGALFRALKDGTICAAGLDVWYNYPADPAARTNTPPSFYPFHELDNVVMSPHRAGHSRETDQLQMAHLAELLNAAARGEAMPNRVDLDAGY